MPESPTMPERKERAPLHEDLDRAIHEHFDRVAGEFDDLSDAIEWFEDSDEAPHHPPDNPEPPEEGAPSWYWGPRAGGRARINGPSVNAFPGRGWGPCSPAMTVMLPRRPGPRGLPAPARQALPKRYFAAAVDAVDRWATLCQGHDLFILTETWPLPSDEIPLHAGVLTWLRRYEGWSIEETRERFAPHPGHPHWHKKAWRYHHEEAGWYIGRAYAMGRAAPLSWFEQGSLHGVLGACAREHGLRVHIALKFGRRAVRLPTIDAAAGWPASG
jgi:hypothetical protein